MSTNISKEKRERLVQKINAIKTYISSAVQDENTAQLLTYIADIEKDIKGKKYGLVFEEHRESIDELLENNLPVLTEDTDLFIDNGGQMNFLIEGDNLASLKLLEKTHKGRIDLIYIDPPYNTGNKDFVYDDSFVDSNDTFRHSKWLSFMKKRLQIARNLLSEKGVIFISIDDNEQSTLKMLCDSVFGESLVEQYIWCLQDKAEGSFVKTAGLTVRKEHEYIIACFKSVVNDTKNMQEKESFQRGLFQIQITTLVAIGFPVIYRETALHRLQVQSITLLQTLRAYLLLETGRCQKKNMKMLWQIIEFIFLKKVQGCPV